MGQFAAFSNLEPLYGVAEETFFIENKSCSNDPYAYEPCSKYDQCLNPSFEQILPRQFTERQSENDFSFANPHCRTTCLNN